MLKLFYSHFIFGKLVLNLIILGVMKYFYCFFLLISLSNCKLLFDDCDVEDKKIGEKYLTQFTTTFIEKFLNKTVVYVDEFGNELKFVEQNGIQKIIERKFININCNSGIGEINKSYDYIEYEQKDITLIEPTQNLVIKYDGRMFSYSSLIPNPIFHDSLESKIYISNGSCCKIHSQLIMSMRGNDNQQVNIIDPQIILDTIILNKQFNNIYKIKKDDLCCYNEQPEQELPNELYISKVDGIIAFKQLNGELWRFDRIE